MDTNESAILLWHAFRKGDHSAFSELYIKYYPDLQPYALKICKNPELSFDAIHNTYVYLWQNKEGLGEITSLKFYLLRSVRHECISLLKKQKKYISLEGVEDEIEILIETEELTLTENSNQVKLKMKQALNTLSHRQREIIYLKFYNNLDYEEIAEILSLNYQSVVNSVHRAIVNLRKEHVLPYLKDL